LKEKKFIMNIKVFHIRLTKEHLHNDEEAINGFLDSVEVKKTATQLITGQPNFWSVVVFYEEKKSKATQAGKLSVSDKAELSIDELKIFDALKQWRFDVGIHENQPPFMICHNAELMAIAKLKPKSIDDLFQIKGFGTRKVEKYGVGIIALLNSI
jgi:superfamily II DNA helicase RecQ